MCRLVWIIFSPQILENLVFEKASTAHNINKYLFAFCCVDHTFQKFYMFYLLIFIADVYSGLWAMLWRAGKFLREVIGIVFPTSFDLHSFNYIIYNNLLLRRSFIYLRNLTLCALCLALSWMLKENLSGFRKVGFTVLCS